MEGEQGEGFTLTLPLILDEKKQGKLEETEADLHCDYTTGTSFFKTLFNGLNALSGQVLYFLFPISCLNIHSYVDRCRYCRRYLCFLLIITRLIKFLGRYILVLLAKLCYSSGCFRLLHVAFKEKMHYVVRV